MKQKQINAQKREVERIAIKTLPPRHHGHAVHFCDKKLKIFKLKKFFKFMYYTGFTYLFTRKLTKTPDLLASLHCFSGKHLRQ